MQHGALYMKTYVRFIIAGDTNIPQKHYVQLTVTCSSAVQADALLGLPRQQWSRERATMLHDTYIAYLAVLVTVNFRFQ
jgi:hypothetical protein